MPVYLESMAKTWQDHAGKPDRGGHWCQSGKHFWTDKADAEKCCDPAWQRILLVGADTAESDVPLQYDAEAKTCYGRKWERVP